MAIFLGLAYCHKVHTGGGKVLPHGAVYGGRAHQILVGNVQVPVVLHHAGILNFWHTHSVKGQVAPLGSLEGPCHLQSSVAPEIKVDDAVAILYCTHWPAIPGYDKLVHILVQKPRVLGSVCLYSLGGRGKLSSPPQHMGLPAPLHHVPVGIVPVHGYIHSAAAGGDAVVHPGKGGQVLFHRCYIIQGAGGIHIPAVQKGVNPELLDSLFISLGNHGLEMVLVGVDIAVGKKADEMECTIIGLNCSYKLFPGCPFEHAT